MKFRVQMPGMSLYPGTGRHWWEQITPADVRRIAWEIDRLGYDYVSISEHLIMDRASAPELGPRWSHSLTAAGVVIGATERVVVVPLVVVPYHHPVELAKSLSTLDFLSGGRVIPLLLVGYNQLEFQIMNVSYDERGAITDEWIDAMHELWCSDDPVFEGRHVRFHDIVFEPRPVRQPMTLWLGGRTLVAMRRIGRVGDGWVAQSTVPRARLPEFVARIREQPEFRTRPRPLDLSFELFEGNRDPITHRIIDQARISLEPEVILEQMQTVADLGATVVTVDDLLGTGKYQNDRPDAPKPTVSASDYLERLQWFAAEVMPAARAISPPSAIISAGGAEPT
jgi:probable F420-dependent oxidoreductase